MRPRCYRTAFLVLAAMSSAALVSRAARADFLTPADTARRACETALRAEAEGQPGISSRIPCHRAMITVGQAEDYRNEVASLMAGRAHPSLDDLVVAALTADAALHKISPEPWGEVARCDIAKKMGNADLMQSCLADMRQLAPNSPLTARAAHDAVRPSAITVLLRVLLALALFGTLAHAIWRRRRPRQAIPVSSPPATVLALTLVSLSLLAGRTALAGNPMTAADMPKPGDPFSKIHIDDADPESSVPTPEEQRAAPLQFGYYLQDLAGKADKAHKEKNYAAEAKYYRALTMAAPEAAEGPRKLCYALQAGGDTKNAVVACRTALTRKGTNSHDYLHFIQVVLSMPGPLSRDEHRELNAVLSHFEGEVNMGALPLMFRCEVALRFNDHDELTDCTDKLGKLAPRDPKTISFQWALALQNHDRAAAHALLDKARAAGMNPAGLQKMEQATHAMTMRWLGRMLVAALALALVLGGSIFALRRAATRARPVPTVQLTPGQ
jgi:hypothetical protein